LSFQCVNIKQSQKFFDKIKLNDENGVLKLKEVILKPVSSNLKPQNKPKK